MDRRLLYAALLGLVVVLVTGALLAPRVFARPEPLLPQPLAYERSSGEELASTTPIVPTHIRIPSIGVDTNVEHVGVAPDGRMAVPSDFDRVGWYRDGARPGEHGKAVLAGHLDNALGRPGVFLRLGQVQSGDIIEVEDADGVTLAFRVARVARYPYDDAPLEAIFGPSELEELVLITCDGTWLPGARMYSERLVVYAVRE